MTTDINPCRTERELIERYGAIALERQTALYPIIANQPWRISDEGSHIIFGNRLICPIQFIGTYVPHAKAWLYAWATPETAFPEAVLAHARMLKEYGERHQNDFLRHHGFQADEADIHKLGLIASGMFQATGYFIAPFQNGVLLLTLHSAKIPDRTREDLAAIPDIFPGICNLFPMNRRNAFVHYLAAKGIEYTESENTVTALRRGTVIGRFDSLGHMLHLEISS